MEVVEKFLLRGMRDMTHKGYINYSAGSRAFCRKNNLITAKNNFSGLKEYILLPDFERNEELEQYLDNLDKGKSTFSGIDYFDNARVIAANLDDLYISFKGTHYDMTNTECVNEENRLGLNLSYGTNTCVMDTGEEYNNISAIWNYAYIPGTTSINLNISGTSSNLPDADHVENGVEVVFSVDTTNICDGTLDVYTFYSEYNENEKITSDDTECTDCPPIEELVIEDDNKRMAVFDSSKDHISMDLSKVKYFFNAIVTITKGKCKGDQKHDCCRGII